MHSAATPEIHRLDVGRATVPYIPYGAPDGRLPLVLLHGISMPVEKWGEFPQHLNRETYAIGLPESHSVPLFPAMSEYARVMTGAIHRIAGRNYDLAGLSWGGLLAQQIADNRRGGPRRLVLAGTMPVTTSMYTAWPDSRAVRIVNSTRRRPEDAKYIYGGEIEDHPELVESLGIDRKIDIRHHARQQLAALALWYSPLAGKNTLMPPERDTLVMIADDDPLMPLRNVRAGAKKLGAELRIMPKGGHGFLLTRPAESAAIVSEFLDRGAAQATPAA